MSDSVEALVKLLVRNIDEVRLRHGRRGVLYESYTARLIPSTGKRGLGAMVVTLPPGKRAVPYHLHHAEDEMYFILEGAGTARVAGELLPVKAGDMVFTPAGRGYPHQIINTSQKVMKYLTIGTHAPADVVEYPDAEKYMAYASDESETVIVGLQRSAANLDYWDGEP